MYLFEANMNLLANTLTPDVAQYHLEKNLTGSSRLHFMHVHQPEQNSYSEYYSV